MAITTIGTNGIADNTITGAKVALASQAAGDVMYYNGTDWLRVGVGTDGQVLTVNNAENAPGWEAASAGATLSGSTNNTVVTVTGADAMIGEANLLFDGTNLGIGIAPDHRFTIRQAGTGDADGMTFQPSGGGHNMRLKLDSSNHFVMSNGGNGGITIDGAGAISSGIKFPATQVASANANTLDDYEEGTWTPEIWDNTNSDGSAGYATQVGRYIKIGKMVYCVGQLTTNSLSGLTTSQYMRIGNLPFTSASISGLKPGVLNCSYAYSLDLNIAGGSLGGYVEDNANHVSTRQWDWTGGTQAFLISEWTSNGQAIFDFCYQAAS